MPHAEVSMLIRAPQARLLALYRDYANWPRLFPATIRGVRLVKAEPPVTTLEVGHVKGVVPNVMTEVSSARIDLWEAKRLYDGTFINHFDPVPEGTRYTVSADIALRGMLKVFGPFLGWYIRRQIVHYVLEPMRQAAERPRLPDVSGL